MMDQRPEPEQAVLFHLFTCKLGASVAVIARATGMSEREVDDALDTLVEEGQVRLVRRTRTSDTYGVTW